MTFDAEGVRAARMARVDAAMEAAFPSTPLNVLSRTINTLAETMPANHPCELIFEQFDAVGRYVTALEAEIDALRAAMAASAERVAELERLNRTWAEMQARSGPYLLGRWADDVFHAVPCDCDEDEEQVGENCMDGSPWTYGLFVSGGAFADRLVQKLPRIPPENDDPEEAVPATLTPREQRIYAAGFEFGRKAAATGARLAAERGLAGEGT